jgi:hypothetical protein
MLYKHGPALEPLALIFELFEVIKPYMLNKQWLAHALYLELIQQKEPLLLIFKLHEVPNQNMLYKHGLGLAVYHTWSSISRRNLWSSSSSPVRFMGST